jgi:hypothetical protein
MRYANTEDVGFTPDELPYGSAVKRQFKPGEVILWRSVNANRTVVGRAWPMTVVRDAPDLIAVYLRPGTVFKMAAGMIRPEQERATIAFDGRHYDAVWQRVDALILHRPGEAHSVWRYQRADDQTVMMWYVNLEEPWIRTSRGFDSRDHGLDVIVAPDRSSWSWKDEDEMDRDITAGRLTPADVAAYRAEGERAAARIMRGDPPFDEDWTLWRPDPAWPVPILPPDWRVGETPESVEQQIGSRARNPGDV